MLFCSEVIDKVNFRLLQQSSLDFWRRNQVSLVVVDMHVYNIALNDATTDDCMVSYALI